MEDIFLAKCLYCIDEREYPQGWKNGSHPCPNCKKLFTLIKDQGNKHQKLRIKELENELAQYQQHTTQLQSQVILERIQKNHEESKKQDLEEELQ